MADFRKRFADGNFDAQFLPDFADKTLLKGFARFAFAAGELP